MMREAETGNFYDAVYVLVRKIPKGRGDWEDKLPESVAKEIIAKELFGYKE